MDIKKLQRVVVDALEDVKAQNIKVFNTVGLSDMFDRVVLASGTSNRQTRALAYRVAQQVKEAGGHVVSVEGADAGEWVLVDLGDLVVHVMQPAVRDYYGLEEIWGGKPVRVKVAESGAKRIVGHAHATEAEEAGAGSHERGVPARMDGETHPPARADLAGRTASSAHAAPGEAPAHEDARALSPVSDERAAAATPPARKAPAKRSAPTGKPAPARPSTRTVTKASAKAVTKRSSMKGARKGPAKKVTAKKVAKSAATKRATAKSGQTAAKSSASKPSAKRSAAKSPKGVKRTATKSAARAAAGKSTGAAPRKSAAKKSAPRKTAARKSATRKKAARR